MAQSQNSSIIIGKSLPHEFRLYSEKIWWVLGKVDVSQVNIRSQQF
jgi:hypothetical protein